jgi:manganese transport protein
MQKNFGAREIFKFIGPGILVTVGFIDPGNWASNVAAGSTYGYKLLWMVSLSTLMLIILQHNAAHLGIVTGLCLSEAAEKHLSPRFSRPILFSAVAAAIATALAELLGAAIALKMLFGLPIKLGTVAVLLFVLWMLYSNAYRKLEKWIIGFVSLIGLSFLFELSLVQIPWSEAARGWVVPCLPDGSLPIVMSVLGAVVMPHNLFLHSEVIQSRQWNLSDDSIIRRQLRFEFLDTLFSMIIGWAINSAMILVAAATFFQAGYVVGELEQAASMLDPLLGKSAAIIFALALLFSGLSSSVTAGMAGGSIFAGMYGEEYDVSRRRTRQGVLLTLVLAAFIIFFVSDPFQGLVFSQMLLSIQLPWTILLQIRLTSSEKVMGKYANQRKTAILLWVIGAIVTCLNIMLLVELLS